MKYTETTKKVILRRRPNPSEAVEMSLLKKTRAGNDQNEYVHEDKSQGGLSPFKRPGSSRKQKDERTDSLGMSDTGVNSKTTIKVNLVQKHVFIDEQEILHGSTISHKKVKEKKKKKIRPSSERLESPKFTVTRQNGHGEIIVVEHPDSSEENDIEEDFADDYKHVQIKTTLEIKESEKIVETKESQKIKSKKKKRSKSANRGSHRKPLIDTQEMIEYQVDDHEDDEADDNLEPVCVPSSIWQV